MQQIVHFINTGERPPEEPESEEQNTYTAKVDDIDFGV